MPAENSSFNVLHLSGHLFQVKVSYVDKNYRNFTAFAENTNTICTTSSGLISFYLKFNLIFLLHMEFVCDHCQSQ